MSKTHRVGARVSLVVWDEGTTLTPGIVYRVHTTPKAEGGGRSYEVLTRSKSGGLVQNVLSAGNARDYLDTPLPDTAQTWAGAYADLEDAARRHGHLT